MYFSHNVIRCDLTVYNNFFPFGSNWIVTADFCLLYYDLCPAASVSHGHSAEWEFVPLLSCRTRVNRENTEKGALASTLLLGNFTAAMLTKILVNRLQIEYETL